MIRFRSDSRATLAAGTYALARGEHDELRGAERDLSVVQAIHEGYLAVFCSGRDAGKERVAVSESRATPLGSTHLEAGDSRIVGQDLRRVEYRCYTCLKKQAQGAKRCSGRSVQAEQIELFVIDKVRSAYADPALVSMVLDAIRARSAARWRDLEARRIALTNERASVQAVGSRERAPLGGFARGRDEIERELREVDAELAGVQSTLPDRKMVQRGLDQFEALWASLTPAEKSQILRLTVKHVRFDGVKGEVQIEMLEDGDGEQRARAPEAAA